ncbi:MAG TPA: GTPase Era [Firmicutes bacterium]|nr:GTPase Era [Bacillota bacterium]
MGESTYKSGFVALVGRPNVGKSTLLNRMVGEKVAITATKPQTTRNRITGIHTTERAQIIFLDTPGIHKPKHKLGQHMVKVAESALEEVDLILFVVDSTAPPGGGDRYIAGYFPARKTPVFLVLNKIDLLAPTEVARVQEEYRELHSFAEIIPVSAVTGDNLALLEDRIIDYLPEGPPYYPADMITDQPERFIVAELIREKVLHLTRDEVPHSIAVEVEEMQEREEKNLILIRANIYVERESQKGILIGRGGRMLKEIGQLSRADIEGLLGCQVYLELWVKVRKDWRDSAEALRNFSYDKQDYS